MCYTHTDLLAVSICKQRKKISKPTSCKGEANKSPCLNIPNFLFPFLPLKIRFPPCASYNHTPTPASVFIATKTLCVSAWSFPYFSKEAHVVSVPLILGKPNRPVQPNLSQRSVSGVSWSTLQKSLSTFTNMEKSKIFFMAQKTLCLKDFLIYFL